MTNTDKAPKRVLNPLIETSDVSSDAVRFEFEIEGCDIRWVVQRVSLSEALNEPFQATINAISDTDPVGTEDLLSKEVVFEINRGGQQRKIRGIISSINFYEGIGGNHYCTFHIVPRLWQLSLGKNSRIHQDITVPDLVQ